MWLHIQHDLLQNIFFLSPKPFPSTLLLLYYHPNFIKLKLSLFKLLHIKYYLLQHDYLGFLKHFVAPLWLLLYLPFQIKFQLVFINFMKTKCLNFQIKIYLCKFSTITIWLSKKSSFNFQWFVKINTNLKFKRYNIKNFNFVLSQIVSIFNFLKIS